MKKPTQKAFQDTAVRLINLAGIEIESREYSRAQKLLTRAMKLISELQKREEE
jgi:hypothetical protein